MPRRHGRFWVPVLRRLRLADACAGCVVSDSARSLKPELVAKVAERPDKARAAEIKCGSSTKKVLLLILVSHLSGAHGTRCHPSIKRIVDLSECGRSTVVRGLNELTEDGIIVKASRRHNKVTVYDIVCLKAGWTPGQKSRSGTSRSPGAGPSEVPERDPEDPREGTTEERRTARPLRSDDHVDEDSTLPSKAGRASPDPDPEREPKKPDGTALMTDDAPSKDTPAPILSARFGGPGPAPDDGNQHPGGLEAETAGRARLPGASTAATAAHGVTRRQARHATTAGPNDTNCPRAWPLPVAGT